MDPNSYFETDPWTFAVERIGEKDLGELRAISIQVEGAGDSLAQVAGQWLSRLESLCPSPIRQDVQQNDRTMSILLEYSGPLLARIFIDAGPGPSVTSFECVGTRGLMIWKPDVHRLSVLYTDGKSRITVEHPYAASLQRKEI